MPASSRLDKALLDARIEVTRLREALYAENSREAAVVTVSADDLAQVLQLIPRGINGMVDDPWTVEPPIHMLVIMARARHMWPGKLDCVHTSEDSFGTSLTIEFELNGRTWRGKTGSCCPDEHVSNMMKEAILWFSTLPKEGE